MSGLHEGISTSRFFFPFLHLNPKDESIFCASFILIGIPIKLSNFWTSNFKLLFFLKFLPVIINLLASPPHILIINSVASCRPSIIELGSIPLSNLYFASVLIDKSRAVFLIEVGRK